MSGRWGGDIKGRRRGGGSRKKRDWTTPRVKPEPPRVANRLQAGTMLVATGFYLVVLAGAWLAALA